MEYRLAEDSLSVGKRLDVNLHSVGLATHVGHGELGEELVLEAGLDGDDLVDEDCAGCCAACAGALVPEVFEIAGVIVADLESSLAGDASSETPAGSLFWGVVVSGGDGAVLEVIVLEEGDRAVDAICCAGY